MTAVLYAGDVTVRRTLLLVLAVSLSLAVAQGTAATAPCSAKGFELELTAQKLPTPVASMRKRIFAAALRCDYTTLVRLGDEHGKGLAFSYGGDRSAAAYWTKLERTKEPVMRALATVLTLPFARTEGFYAWPSAHREKPSDADWKALRALYPQSTIDRMRRGGIGYFGWRVGIRPDGNWMYFISGD